MSSAKYFAAITNLWTSCNSHTYLSYTVHFIADVPLFEDHMGQNIAEAILDILENWGLSQDNLVAITTDNGRNFISGIAQLECTRISCFDHNLDLAINKSLNITRVQQTEAGGNVFSLEAFSTFTDALAGEKVVTVLAVHPLLKNIREDLLVVSSVDCSLVKEMKETTSDDLSVHYIDLELSELIDKCSYLDPRFRTRYLNNKGETLVQIKSEAITISDDTTTCQEI